MTVSNKVYLFLRNKPQGKVSMFLDSINSGLMQ